ncbi:response regulator transcription factor [Methylomonas sp. UP202]|uniref:response regulator transcription factor n=1 Tax=Methylomonas sp. UP202 TaxID=3040943 RepID=UPI002478D3FB|nr:response regulator transcription factor [Methylomonas sp. UP202]WGS85421.1 response regulator transcription factor [Methylomonas sp. UP202]
MSHSVLIVEDDPQFRATFADAIASAADLRLAGVADDLSEGRRLLEQTKPDVLLVDIGLPSGSGIELIRWARQYLPRCDVMVITVFGDERHVLQCIEAGATGYLLKGASSLDIVEQIRALYQGGSPISPTIARQLLIKRFQHNSDDSLEGQRLSTQERTVLEMSSKGYSYEEIAELMQLSSNTVGTYVKRIYLKLQVHSKSEAIYEARKLGLLRD